MLFQSQGIEGANYVDAASIRAGKHGM